jgi:hypothetical protein
MLAIARALIASAFAVTSFTAQAETVTVDFFGDGLDDTHNVSYFDTSYLAFSSNLVASNIVTPELTFSGLAFSGTDNFLTMRSDLPIDSVTLNFVRITSLEFSGGLSQPGSVYGVAQNGVTDYYVLNAELLGDAASITFTPRDTLPFISLEFAFTSPQFVFVDPEYGDETIMYALYGLDSVSFNTVTAPIPEPETYAMMLAGLGAIGFVSRRKKAQLVNA